MKRIKDFVLHEWNVILSFVAFFSLLFIYPYIPTKARLEAMERDELESVKYFISNAYYDDAKKGIAAFVERHPSSNFVAEAYYLLARIDIDVTKEKGFFAPNLNSAISNLKSAAEYGFEKSKVDASLLEVAYILRDNNSLDKSIEIFKSLTVGDKYQPSILLDIAISYALYRTVTPEDEVTRLKQSFEYIDKFLAVASEAERIDGHLVKARCLRLHNKYRGASDILDAIEKTYKDSPKMPLLYLERGKLYLKQGILDKAEQDLITALTGLTEKSLADEATYFLGETYLKGRDKRAIAQYQKLIQTGSLLSPIANLSAGRYLFSTKRDESLEYIVAGLRGIITTIMLDKYEFDVPAFRDMLKEVLTAESNVEKLVRYVDILKEIERLYPSNLVYFRDSSEVYKRIASHYTRLGDEQLGAGLENEAVKMYNIANSYYMKSALKYLDIVGISELSDNEKASAYRDAADAFFTGKYYINAAENYGIYSHYNLNPQYGVFMEGLSLKLNGIYEAKDPSAPDALKAFNKCIANFNKFSDYTRKAILEKGKILMELGRYQLAIEEFNRLLQDEQGLYDANPLSDEWRRALYLKGVTYYLIASKQRRDALSSKNENMMKNVTNVISNARTTFSEFVERYVSNVGTNSKPDGLGLGAMFYLAKTYSDENQWGDALKHFRSAVEFGLVVYNELNGEEKEMLKQSYFNIGDMLFNTGNYPDARKAYDSAYRKYSADKERIWGLIGISRCYLKMGKNDEAKLWYENAKNTLESKRDAYKEAPRGFGVEFWESRLNDLKVEIGL